MDAYCAWTIFLETGAPEMYLLYTELKEKERAYVHQSTRTRAESN